MKSVPIVKAYQGAKRDLLIAQNLNFYRIYDVISKYIYPISFVATTKTINNDVRL